MTIFEILSFNKELLQKINAIGFKTEDCRFIDLYSEYEQMRNNGDKTTWIVAVLADKYKVSVRKVYTIVKTFKKDCTEQAAESPNKTYTESPDGSTFAGKNQ
jgi:hypothetical protein